MTSSRQRFSSSNRRSPEAAPLVDIACAPAGFSAVRDELETLYAALGKIESGVLLLDKELRAQYANPALHAIFKSPPDVIHGRLHFAEMVRHSWPAYASSSAEADAYIARRLALVRAGDPTPVDLRLKCGRVIRSQCAVLPGGGRMLTYSDVTDIVRNAEELERLATIDGMTGIYNRRHFLTLADREWSRCGRYGHALSFLMIDIDFFKSINDNFGHEVGDRMIAHLAALARDCKRNSDVLARIGGEEFAMLLPETNLTQARSIAERLRGEVAANPLAAAAGQIPATVSIGAAVAVRTMSGIADLMKAADQALYDAKRSGRDRVVCWVSPRTACGGRRSPRRRHSDRPPA